MNNKNYLITNKLRNIIKIIKMYNNYYGLFLDCVNKINFFNNYNKSIKCYFTNNNFIITTEDKEKKEIYKLIVNTNQKISYFINNKIIFFFTDYLSRLLDDKNKLKMSLYLNLGNIQENNDHKINDSIINFITFILS